MRAQRLVKQPERFPVPPNLQRYDEACAGFSWDAARRGLAGLPGGRGINIAHEAVDRHATGPDRVALRWLDRDGRAQDYTYAELARLTRRFAAVLRRLGVGPGDRVFAASGRIPELWIAALGALKNGCVFCPLFSAYGPEPLRTRLEAGRASVLVTTQALFERKIAPLRDSLPDLRHVLVVAGARGSAGIAGTLDFHSLLDAADDRFEIGPTDPEDPALLFFTSGTTGSPKGAVHVHDAVVAHRESARLALDLRPGDRFWCTADPGWVTGTVYGLIAPLTVGATVLADVEEFDVARWARVLDTERVDVWYTAPTALRMMMRVDGGIGAGRRRRPLRFVASVGEPLDPAAVLWGREVLGLPVHDTWWQTETGAIMIANFASADIKPGSMGRPLPGVEAAVVQRAEDGSVRIVEQPDGLGELALRSGWPSMFRAYLGEPERYRGCFADGWYLSGDLARRDDEGYFWFVGRADDVIKSAGHLVGPFEVEAALLEHPAVAEVGVVGRPDPVLLERVKAFVRLKPHHEPTDALRRELVAHARRRLGAALAPREVEFRAGLPKTRSGKILRRQLKAEAAEAAAAAGDRDDG